MLNFIKADLYRLSRSKAFRYSVGNMLIFFIAMTIYVSGNEGSLGLISIGDSYGYRFRGPLIHGSLVELLEPALGFTVIVCIIMLFIISDLVIERYKVGMLHAPIAYGGSREKIYLSNLLVSILAVLGIGLGVMMMTLIVWGSIFTREYKIDLETIKQIVEIIGTWCLIIIAMISSWTLLATLIREKVIIVGLGILNITFIGGALIMGVGQNMIQSVPNLMLMQLCTNPMMNTYLGKYRVNATVIIFITTLVGCMIFRKQDIK